MSSEENLDDAVVQIDAQRFTDTEREIILQVVARDEDIRLQEKTRIEHLKDELYELQEKGVPESEEETCGRVCRRCRTPLGLLFNSGALCPSCEKTVCKTCRVPIEDQTSWVCTVCGKIREIRAESGAWFYTESNPEETKTKKKKVYGSFLMKKVFSRTRKNDKVIFNDPDWSNVLEKENIPADEASIEDKTYLVISPSISGEFNVKEGNHPNSSINNTSAPLATKTSAPSATVSGSSLVDDVNSRDALVAPQKPAHANATAENEWNNELKQRDEEAEQPRRGLDNDERETLLSILHRSKVVTSRGNSVSEDKRSNEKRQEDEEEKDEQQSEPSIYYRPEDDTSSSEDEHQEEKEGMKTIPEEAPEPIDQKATPGDVRVTLSTTDTHTGEVICPTETVDSELPIATGSPEPELQQQEISPAKDHIGMNFKEDRSSSDSEVSEHSLCEDVNHSDTDEKFISKDEEHIVEFHQNMDEEISQTKDSSVSSSSSSEDEEIEPIPEEKSQLTEVDQCTNNDVQETSTKDVLSPKAISTQADTDALSVDTPHVDPHAFKELKAQEQAEIPPAKGDKWSSDSDRPSSDEDVSRQSDDGEDAQNPEAANDGMKKEEIEEEIDSEFLQFVDETYKNNNDADVSTYQFHQIEEEAIQQKPAQDVKIMKQMEPENQDDSILRIDFTSMQRVDYTPETPYVVYNDLDLKDLHKSFVKRRKNVKIVKMKTDEHSDGSDTSDSSSDSSDSEEDFVVPQVVSVRKNSFEEELENFKLVAHSVPQKLEAILLDEEIISTEKPNIPKQIASNVPEEKNRLPFSTNFSLMPKISDLKSPSSVESHSIDNDNHDDLNAFMKSLSRKKFREKYNKVRTDEHSDKESSSEESDDAVQSGDEVKDEPPALNGHLVEDSSLNKQAQFNEADNIDEIFAEYGQHDDIGDADSIGSNYSDDDDMQQTAQIAGEIYIGLRYDHKEKMFEVQVHKARGLIIGDPVENTSNSYVKVYLLPNTKRSGKRKTKIVKKNLDPEYDQILTFQLEYDQLLSRTCGISVWHSNFTQKNKRLGEVFVNIEEYLNSGFKLEDPSPQWYTLTGRTIEREQVEFCGELFVNIAYRPPGTNNDPKKKQNPTKGELAVHVIRAQNLKALHEGGFSNPFCKIQLLSGGSKTEKFKTHHVKGTIEPYWDKQFVFSNIALNDLRHSILQFSVWDVEKGSSHALLGGARLGLGEGEGAMHDSFGEEVTMWKRILENPNDDIECTISLRSTLDSVKEKAFVPPTPLRVMPLGDHEEHKKKFGSTNSLTTKKFLQPDAISLASTGSMLSLYSNAGGDGNLTVTGEILFSVKYDDLSGIFSVNIEKAKGLAAVDTKKMTSDPYVKVYLLPDKLKSSKKKTLHRRKTTNPIWNETIKYKLSKEELLSKTLQLTIWNHDRFGKNDCLGEVQLNMKQYANTNKLEADIPVWYTLQELAPVVGGGADDNKGELLLGLKFDQDVLTVLVKEANGLPSLDEKSIPNPFVKCYFLPDKSRKSKRKTGVQKKTISPTWNEKLTYKNISVEDLQTRVLEITVWDYNSSSHQFLGGVRLGLPNGDESWHDSHDSEVSIWESMITHLGILAEYKVPLRKSMTSMKDQIKRDIPMITSTLREEDHEEDNRYQQSDNVNYYQQQKSVNEAALDNVPTIRLSLQYVSPEQLESGDDKKKKKKQKGELRVNIKESKNLPLKPNKDYPSTFCKILLHPKKKSEKFQTETYYKSINPVWDTSVTFEDVLLDELRTRTLEVILLDEIKEKKGDEFARVRIGSGGFIDKFDDSQGPEIDLWFLMLNNPEKWNTKLIPLRIEEYPEEPVKPTKKEKKPPKKQEQLEEEEEEVSEPESENQEITDTTGSESPRTSALRAMGGAAAANVIDMMTPKNEPAYFHSSDGLHTIDEENELESSGSVSKPTGAMSMAPSITITTTSDIKRGDPPFQREDYYDDEPEFDYRIPEKKKPPPQMSLLKRSESMTSVYSTDSANIYGQVPIRGEIQFGMKYDHNQGMFEVHIFQAKDLAAVDTKKEVSDPYCKVYLLPDKTKGGKRKTRTIKKSLYPEWEEILEYKITYRDLRTRTLNVSLFHQERLGRNVFLGEVMLQLDEFVDDPKQLELPTPKWYELMEKTTPPKMDLFKGELLISLMFEDDSLNSIKEKVSMGDDKKKSKKKKKKEKMATTGRINLHIKKCLNLPAADKDGLSDPFCKCYLLPKQNKNKRKTPVIKDTLEPEWDYKTEYDIDYEDLMDHGIELTVWDWDKGKSNDLLGCTRIGLGNKTVDWDDAEGVEVLAWQHMIDQPNKWKDFVIPLRSKADSRIKKR